MKYYGYSRNDFPRPILEQLKILEAYNIEDLWIESSNLNCDEELKKLLDILSLVDMEKSIVVSDLAVFGKILSQLLPILEIMEESNIYLISINDQINTKYDKCFFQVCKNLQKANHDVRKEVASQVILKKKQAGILLGRPKISNEKIEEMHNLYKQKYNYREISEKCNISLGSVYKYINLYKNNNEKEK